ncbi:putative fatty acid hydroxylase [Talaromyces proteolyticus]|uniref:Bifunctional cytochrome P450/NADPH--P450 reductase n=1 Tax=Talaromyces proteolyticus TaxID=1131652 RepID=A0AAD4L144_9EURO|nr:putative fatty acid hydroxylase [Talaromyces proteolyticus]KAH8703590.1 putative fatty acid hydroxylase [Talaromyces proteolyticus]
MTEQEYTPIPQPPGVPLLGNIFDIDGEVPLTSLELLADTYGPIYRLTTFGVSRVLISSHELVDEVCNEERFRKAVFSGLREIRHGIHDGLFTADYPGEENWAIAHRVLVPAFGPIMIRGMFDEMYDIATQLVLKWARQGPKHAITPTDDFTRLTLDTIALCAMGTRFNSFYHEEMHPFVDAMMGMLIGAGQRARRPGILNGLPTSDNTKFFNDIAACQKIARDLLEDRRNNPEPEKKDLLNAMILGRDPKTGQGLNDDTIINNMITFLIAGHETTSGSLSFLFYFLLKTPHAYKKAQEEVDNVIGRRKITVEDLSKLPYINACLREALRLRPTAPAIVVEAHPTKNHEDPVTLGNGKYKLEKGEKAVIIIPKLHLDPAVWGEDAAEFKPERMLDGKFEKYPKNAWKPFGNGMRGCIGRPFAWQEMLIVVAMLLQNFNFQLDDPSYNLRIKQALTVKPKDFQIRATLREGLDATTLDSVLNSGQATKLATREQKHVAASGPAEAGKPMHIFFGSNTGTCEAFARRLAEDAAGFGYSARIDSLDSAMQKIPKSDPVVFITASYEGQPPDNAALFFEWLNGLKGNELEGVNYAVFGAGHRDWAATFHRIPKAVNNLVSERGGNRLCEIGVADTADADIFTAFDTWGESSFWPAMQSQLGAKSNGKKSKPKSALDVKISSGMRATTLGLNLGEALVVENQLLTSPDVPDKRLVKFQLPSDTSYQCGDYLAVLPVNPSNVVRKAIRRFGLPWDAMLTIQKAPGATSGPSIPLDTPISAFELLSTYVELSQPVSKRDINVLADAAAADPDTQAELRFIASSPTRFAQDIVAKRISPLDLLIRYPKIDLPIGDYLSMLPPMRVRQYSISSSPIRDPSECSVTLSVLNSPSLSAAHDMSEEERYLGVASTYLSSLKPGDRAHVSVRPSNSGFKPPVDLQTPMIMAAAGSGIGPFRGFIMDRAEKIKARGGDSDLKPATAILYAGCRTKDKDDLHAEELAEWERLGAVQVHWAYSRPEGTGQKKGYVQDAMLANGADLIDLFNAGARIYVCGSNSVGNGVRETIKKLYVGERRKKLADGSVTQKMSPELDEEAAVERFFEMLRTNERFVTDVFT